MGDVAVVTLDRGAPGDQGERAGGLGRHDAVELAPRVKGPGGDGGGRGWSDGDRCRGDRIAADGLLLQAHELATDESMLTGESEPVAKQASSDRAFAGTLVVRGQGLMRVEAIGHATERR